MKIDSLTNEIQPVSGFLHSREAMPTKRCWHHGIQTQVSKIREWLKEQLFKMLRPEIEEVCCQASRFNSWLLWEQGHFSRLIRDAAARFNVEFGEDVHNIASIFSALMEIATEDEEEAINDWLNQVVIEFISTRRYSEANASVSYLANEGVLFENCLALEDLLDVSSQDFHRKMVARGQIIVN